MINQQEAMILAQNTLNLEAAELIKCSENLSNHFYEICQQIIKCQGRVIISGMGKSGLVGRKMSATLSSTGTPSSFLHPAEAYHGDLGEVAPKDLVVLISQSGETEEVIRLLPFLKHQKNILVAMTGQASSTLAKNADYFLSTFVTKEACPLELAPTSSTTLTLALGDAISVVLMKMRSFQKEEFARFHPGGSLGKKLLTKVSHLMKKDQLPIISTQQAFSEVVHAISSGRMGMCIVKDSSLQKVLGVITDGDLRRFMMSTGPEIFKKNAGDLMTKNPKWLKSNLAVFEAQEKMVQMKISVCLVGDGEHLEGVLHLYDL